MIRLKRAYEPAAKADGRRVLVERLWPRGVPKARLRLDEWAKDVAPSPALRRGSGTTPSGGPSSGDATWPSYADILRRGSRSSPRRGAGG